MVLDSYQEVCQMPNISFSKEDLKVKYPIFENELATSLPAILSQILGREEDRAFSRYSQQVANLVLDHSVVYEIGYTSELFTKLIVDKLKSSAKSVLYYSASDIIISPKASCTNNHLKRQPGSVADTLHKVSVQNYPAKYESSIKGQIQCALDEHTSAPKVILLARCLVNIFPHIELLQLLKYVNQKLKVGDRLIVDFNLNLDKLPCSKFQLMEELKRVLPAAQGEGNPEGSPEGKPPLIFRENHLRFCNTNLKSQNLVLNSKTPTSDPTSSQNALEGINITFLHPINILESYKDFSEMMSTCEFCPGPSYITDNKDSKFVIASFYKPEFYFLPKHLGPNKPTPGLNSWNQLFKAWDYVTGQMITPDMRLEQPISLRHPFIFYLGHIPAFLDIQISRHFQQPYTEPSYYVNIFERGIDPDVDDPTKCHDHSEVPKDWPKYENIMAYDARVRERLSNILKNETLTARLGRVLFMTFEHQAMHLETLMYMLIQSDNFVPVSKQLTMFNDLEQTPLSPSPWIQVEGGSLSLGHDDDENEDHQKGYFDIREYGWDNETPSRQAMVKPFTIQSRPVTNIEFFEFIKSNPDKPIPALWTPEPTNRFGYKVRSFHGALPFEQCINWPVQVCYRDILSYFEWKGDGSRLPTEEELTFCDQNYYKLNEQLNSNSQYLPPTYRENVGFKHWNPTAVTNDSFNLMEILWEWTGSFLGPYPGYHPSELYPGYSYDFHDEKHLVVLGGSYLSNPWFAKRITFRNWFHEGYPYAFIGFRAVKDI